MAKLRRPSRATLARRLYEAEVNKEGLSAVADSFGVSRITLYRWRKDMQLADEADQTLGPSFERMGELRRAGVTWAAMAASFGVTQRWLLMLRRKYEAEFSVVIP